MKCESLFGMLNESLSTALEERKQSKPIKSNTMKHSAGEEDKKRNSKSDRQMNKSKA